MPFKFCLGTEKPASEADPFHLLSLETSTHYNWPLIRGFECWSNVNNEFILEATDISWFLRYLSRCVVSVWRKFLRLGSSDEAYSFKDRKIEKKRKAMTTYRALLVSLNSITFFKNSNFGAKIFLLQNSNTTTSLVSCLLKIPTVTERGLGWSLRAVRVWEILKKWININHFESLDCRAAVT